MVSTVDQWLAEIDPDCIVSGERETVVQQRVPRSKASDAHAADTVTGKISGSRTSVTAGLGNPALGEISGAARSGMSEARRSEASRSPGSAEILGRPQIGQDHVGQLVGIADPILDRELSRCSPRSHSAVHAGRHDRFGGNSYGVVNV